MGICASTKTMQQRSSFDDIESGRRDSTRSEAEEKVVKAIAMKRRVDIFSAGFDVGQEFHPKVFKKSGDTSRFIANALKDNFLFASLPAKELKVVVDAFEPLPVQNGSLIIKQGDVGDNFYIQDSGSSAAHTEKHGLVKEYSRGGCFGELALLYDAPRAATVRATSDGQVWKLDRDTFRFALADAESKNTKKTLKALRKVAMLQPLSDDQLRTLADSAQVTHFDAGTTIIAKGEMGSVFFFLLHGTVSFSELSGSVSQRTITHEDDLAYFGERALITNEPRAATVTAVNAVECICIDKKDFTEQLGDLSTVLDRNFKLRVLRDVELLQKLGAAERDAVINSFSTERFKDGETIMKQGDPGDKFYVIRDGQVRVTKKEDSGKEIEVALLNGGNFFGDQALISNGPRNASCTAVNGADVYSISREEFTLKIGGRLQDVIAKAEQRRRKDEARLKEEIKNRGGNIRLQELVIMRTLGTGTFGRVKLVNHPQSKRNFALKIMQKAQVVEYRQQKNVVNEKNVMEQARHPFILELITTFQDESRLYMLIELCLGGELFTYLHCRGREGGLSVPDTLFYASCTLDGLAYLHKKFICYRDLKPENLLLDDSGYIKIVDFGFAKVVKDKTFTLCGTPEYLSPEIILSKGHNKGVDYWALGVLIYEMRYTYSPFCSDDAADHMVICKNIVRNKLKFPNPQEARTPLGEAVQALLVSDPKKRLGCMRGGGDDVKRHPFFATMNFDKLRKKEVPSPWRPNLNSKDDAHYFDEDQEPDDDRPYKGTSFYDASGWDKDF
eukprot:g3933.t1